MRESQMRQSELDMLRYRHATLSASPNTSNGQRADSETILSLLDMIQFYQDEWDRQRGVVKPTEEDSNADKS